MVPLSPCGGGGGSDDEPIANVRDALATRLASCWHRLDDVVSELVALHTVTDDVIVAHVRHAIEAEHRQHPDEAAIQGLDSAPSA